MATFRSTFGIIDSQHVSVRPDRGEGVFVGNLVNGLDELTTSGTSGIVQDGGGDFTAPVAGYVTMKADGPVHVHIAAVPVAVVAKGLFLDLGERCGAYLLAGDKIAVIDDS